jgi:hypothetical protein
VPGAEPVSGGEELHADGEHAVGAGLDAGRIQGSRVQPADAVHHVARDAVRVDVAEPAEHIPVRQFGAHVHGGVDRSDDVEVGRQHRTGEHQDVAAVLDDLVVGLLAGRLQQRTTDGRGRIGRVVGEDTGFGIVVRRRPEPAPASQVQHLRLPARRGPFVEIQPPSGLLQIDPDRGAPRRRAAVEVVVQPGDIGTHDGAQLTGLAVQPRPDDEAGRHPGGSQAAVAGQEEVPPAGESFDRGHPAEARCTRAFARGSGSPPSRAGRSWRPICADQLNAVWICGTP